MSCAYQAERTVGCLALLFAVVILVATPSVTSCGSTGTAVVTKVHEEVFSVDRDAFDGLWNPVVERCVDLCGEGDGELLAEILARAAVVDGYKGNIPYTAAHQVAFVCDMHDLLVLTALEESPYSDFHLRSTEILRGLFVAAGEPLIQ